MTNPGELKTYSDIRKLVSPQAFSQALSYISWHNRLAMTDMLYPWEALVVTLAHEQKSFDGMMYSAIKAFLDETRDSVPQSLEECRERAMELVKKLYPEQP